MIAVRKKKKKNLRVEHFAAYTHSNLVKLIEPDRPGILGGLGVVEESVTVNGVGMSVSAEY